MSIEIDFGEWPRYHDYANIFNALEKASPTRICGVARTKYLYSLASSWAVAFSAPSSFDCESNAKNRMISIEPHRDERGETIGENVHS